MNRPVLIAAALSLAAVPAFAGDRVFAFGYGTSTLAEGRTDLELHATLEAHSRDDHDFRELETREEVEYGLTNSTQVSLYLDQRYLNEPNDVGGRDHTFKFTTVDGEIIHSLTSSAEDGLGTAVYGELSAGGEHLGVEAKFLVEKQVEQFDFIANFVLEKEWDGVNYEEDTLTPGLVLGASYALTPNFSAGAESRIEKAYDLKEKEWADTETYVGPNFAWHNAKAFVVVAPLFQVSRVSDAPEYMAKVVAGWKF